VQGETSISVAHADLQDYAEGIDHEALDPAAEQAYDAATEAEDMLAAQQHELETQADELNGLLDPPDDSAMPEAIQPSISHI
jgi:anti-sigma factor RsiW